MSLSTNLSLNVINTVDHAITHTHDHVILKLDLLDLTSREQKRTTPAITLLQVKTNLTTSAELKKTILFDRKIF